MKILIDNTLPMYIGPLAAIETTLAAHNPFVIPTFDIFDKFSPDLYICNPSYITPAVVKNIQERPALKVVFIQRDQSEQTLKNKEQIEAIFGSGLYPWFEDIPRADLLFYSKSEVNKDYLADIVTFDSAINPSINDFKFSSKLIYRIFSIDKIKSNYYCGFVPDHSRKSIYKSSKVSISYGDNFYNSALCDCFPVSATSEDEVLAALNTNNAKNIKQIKDQIYSVNNNFTGLSNILNLVGCESEAKKVLKKAEEVL